MKNVLFFILGSLVLGAAIYAKKMKVFSPKEQQKKVLELVSCSRIKSLDPKDGTCSYCNQEMTYVYEGLLEYHYLKRPVELTPCLAASMPTLSKDGKTYTFKLRKGVLFHDDPCFPNGVGRELVAQDVVYSWMRLKDPNHVASGALHFKGEVKGMSAWVERNRDKKTNYDESIEGLQALDQYTLQVTLTKPCAQFLWGLCHPAISVVPREAVEHYGKEFINHPVGTGPFVLKDFSVDHNKLVYTRHTQYRKVLFPTEGDPKYQALIKKYGGKRIPMVDQLVTHIITEAHPRFLKFDLGKLDMMELNSSDRKKIKEDSEIAQRFKDRGVQTNECSHCGISYIGFNMEHRLFKKNLKLRQAMSYAFDREAISKLFGGLQGRPAFSLLAPELEGSDLEKKSYQQYNLTKAKQLLEEIGHPNGKGLPIITFDVSGGTLSRQYAECFKKMMAQVGIRIKVIQNLWPELLRKEMNGDFMLFKMGWGPSYPDPITVLCLLYRPNKCNGTKFNDPEFNQLYEQSLNMKKSTDRTDIYRRLNEIATVQAPMLYSSHFLSGYVSQPWVKAFVVDSFIEPCPKFVDVDLDEKNKRTSKN